MWKWDYAQTALRNTLASIPSEVAATSSCPEPHDSFQSVTSKSSFEESSKKPITACIVDDVENVVVMKDDRIHIGDDDFEDDIIDKYDSIPAIFSVKDDDPQSEQINRLKHWDGRSVGCGGLEIREVEKLWLDSGDFVVGQNSSLKKSFEKDGWVLDSVIDLYIYHQLNCNERKTLAFIDCLTHLALLQDVSPEKTKRVLDNKLRKDYGTLQDKEFLLMPINQNNQHWYLMAFARPGSWLSKEPSGSSILIMDSLRRSKSWKHYVDTSLFVIRFVAAYLQQHICVLNCAL